MSNPLPVLPQAAVNGHGAQPQDVAAELQRARRYRAGTGNEPAEALEIYRRLAEAGNAAAQIGLADMYRDGIATAA
ncbi:MAG: hypothetical protein ACREE7_13795, partial [Dongiaceae bacterium]